MTAPPPQDSPNPTIPGNDPGSLWHIPRPKPAQWIPVLLLLIFLVTRLWNLGIKPLHHDESLFAYYGYNLAIGNGYNYMPILHGPVLQFANALLFILFGDSHFVMRLPAALGGLALALAFWAWRRELARAAGLSPDHHRHLIWVPVGVSLVLLALSPSITYYSRFLRNDAPYLAATVACALWTLRAFRDGSPRSLSIAVLLATLMFSMMESSIFFFVACLGFLAAILGMHWLRGSDQPATPTMPVPTGTQSTVGPVLAALLAAPAAAEIMVRLPLSWPHRTSFLVLWLLLGAVHIAFLRQASQPDSLCSDILRLASRVRSYLLALFALLVGLTLLPLLLGSQAPPLLAFLASLSPVASFLLMSASAFVACAATVQALGWLLSGRKSSAKTASSPIGTSEPQPLHTLGMFAWSVLHAALGTVLLSWLYWRIFMDTVPVSAPLEVLFAALGIPISRVTGLALMAGLLSLVLLALSFVYLRALQLPGSGPLRPFVQTLHRSRLVLFLTLCGCVFAYQALFTTLFTHTTDKTFNHQIRDFADPTAPLTPVQIYKNTWDYWWDQHKEHRIKGPFHYYLPILGLYEWPALLLVAGWLGAFVFRPTARRWARLALLFGPQVLLATLVADWAPRISWSWMDAKFHVTHPLHLHLALFYLQAQFLISPLLWRAGRRTEAFLLFWTVTQIFAYSYAGEKVPWLSIHTAGPLLLLAGVAAGRMVANWPTLPQTVILRRQRWALILVGAVCLWQAKSLLSACFLWPHSPRERIVFNHTSPDVEWALKEVERVGIVTGQGDKLAMFIDGEMAWPLYWYLRHRPEAFNRGDETLETTRRPIVICNWDDVVTNKNLTDNYRVVRLKVREWWEPAMLNWQVMADIHLALTARESRRPDATGQDLALRLQAAQREWIKLGRHLLFREIFLDPKNPDFSNSGNQFCLAIRKDLEPSPSPEYINEAPFRREIPIVR